MKRDHTQVLGPLALIGFLAVIYWLVNMETYTVELDMAAWSEGQAYLVEKRWWGLERNVYPLEYRFTGLCDEGCWYYRKSGKWRTADGRSFSHDIQHDPPSIPDMR